MTRYVAFLRGINVGGHKPLKMEALRTMLAMPGFKNVTTYIQSGNVLFEAKETEPATLAGKIERQLLKQLGYDIKVFVRTADEIAAIIDNSPFKNIKEDEVLYVFFLSDKADKEKATLLGSLSTDTEQYKAAGAEVFGLCRKIDGHTNFSNAFVEKKLGAPASARNMTTVKKLLTLLTSDK